MFTCGEWSATKYEDGVWVAVPLRCRRWNCPTCARRQKRRFLKSLSETSVDALLTLTCDPKRFRDPTQAFRLMSHQIPNLMKRLRRHFPLAAIDYLVVWEETRRGWPHAHVLMRGPYLPQRLISRLWRELAFSPIVDIRRVHQRREVAAYVGKYLSKQPRVPPGYRRFRSSQTFWAGEPPNRHHRPDGPSLWSLWRKPLYSIVSFWAAFGLDVTMIAGYRVEGRRAKPPPLLNFSRALGTTLPLTTR